MNLLVQLNQLKQQVTYICLLVEKLLKLMSFRRQPELLNKDPKENYLIKIVNFDEKELKTFN